MVPIEASKSVGASIIIREHLYFCSLFLSLLVWNLCKQVFSKRLIKNDEKIISFIIPKFHYDN